MVKYSKQDIKVTKREAHVSLSIRPRFASFVWLRFFLSLSFRLLRSVGFGFVAAQNLFNMKLIKFN